MSIFVCKPPFFKVPSWVAMETIQIHITKVALVLRTIFLHALRELASVRKYVLHVGAQCKSDYPLGKESSLSNVFSLFLSFHQYS